MERKGQAAMEFLMTYGWAILAAIIAIAVLAYFGVFSPGRYMPNVCTLNAPFGCDEYKITTAGATMVIRNGAGESVTISSVALTNCGNDSSVGAVADGATVTVEPSCTLTSGNKFKGDVTITYTKTGGTLTQTATGSISGKVE